MKNTEHFSIQREPDKIIVEIHNNLQKTETPTFEKKEESVVNNIIVAKVPWYRRLLSWMFNLIILFLKWLWSHPKKLISAGLAALMMWLSSFFPFKLPNLPFLPKLPTVEKQNENPKKSEEKQKQDSGNNKPVDSDNKPTNSVPSNDDAKVSTQYVTNTITQTNIVTQTNYVTETKYVTNFVVQPIVVTNTVYKEVPITVTNVLVIKNNVGNSDTNSNKTGNMNGPAFYFTDDFNTLLQNQRQNPIRGGTVN
jgi:hypothetical protein